jgi:hypothetical protein
MSREGKSQGRWTIEEHSRFLKGLELYGKDYKLLKAFIQTRSVSQIRTHQRNHTQKLSKTFKGAVAVAAVSSDPMPNQPGGPKKRKSDAPEDGDSKKAKSDSNVEPRPSLSEQAKVTVDSSKAQASPCRVSVDSNDATKTPAFSSFPGPKVPAGAKPSACQVSVDSSDAMKTPALSSFSMPKLATVTKESGSDRKEEADTDDLKPPVMVPIVKEFTEAASASVAPDSSTTDVLPEKPATISEVVSSSSKDESQSNHDETTAKAAENKEIKEEEKTNAMMPDVKSNGLVFDLLLNENVQSILAGLGGYMIIFFLKKLCV